MRLIGKPTIGKYLNHGLQDFRISGIVVISRREVVGEGTNGGGKYKIKKQTEEAE